MGSFVIRKHRFLAENRLKQPEEFKYVFSSRLRYGERFFLLIARKNGGRKPRLGLAVPKKHIRSSVKRNRIKRLIRENFRLNKDLIHGFDVVVLIRNNMEKKGVIAVDFKKHWEKIVQ